MYIYIYRYLFIYVYTRCPEWVDSGGGRGGGSAGGVCVEEEHTHERGAGHHQPTQTGQ